MAIVKETVNIRDKHLFDDIANGILFAISNVQNIVENNTVIVFKNLARKNAVSLNESSKFLYRPSTITNPAPNYTSKKAEPQVNISDSEFVVDVQVTAQCQSENIKLIENFVSQIFYNKSDINEEQIQETSRFLYRPSVLKIEEVIQLNDVFHTTIASIIFNSSINKINLLDLPGTSIAYGRPVRYTEELHETSRFLYRPSLLVKKSTILISEVYSTTVEEFYRKYRGSTESIVELLGTSIWYGRPVKYTEELHETSRFLYRPSLLVKLETVVITDIGFSSEGRYHIRDNVSIQNSTVTLIYKNISYREKLQIKGGSWYNYTSQDYLTLRRLYPKCRV